MKIIKVIATFVFISFLFSLALVLGLNTMSYFGTMQTGTNSGAAWFNPVDSLQESYASDYDRYANTSGGPGYEFYSSDANAYGAQDISAAGYSYYVSDSNSYGYDEVTGGYKLYTSDYNKYAQYDSIDISSEYYESNSYDTEDFDSGYDFYTSDVDNAGRDNVMLGYMFYSSDYKQRDTDFQ